MLPQKLTAQGRDLAIEGELAIWEEACWVDRPDPELKLEDEVSSGDTLVWEDPETVDSFQRRRVVPVTLSRWTATSRESSLSRDAKTIVAPSQDPSG
jgi:hypothetical protein